MTESTVRTGSDTFNNSAATTTEYGDWKRIRVRSGVHEAFAYFPLPTLRGRTVLSAPLAGHALGTWAAQTLTIRLASAAWAPATLNWANRPGVTGPTVTVATGALSDGGEWSVDIATLLQDVANGTPWHGLRITTSAATVQTLYGFKWGKPAWSLTYELSDAPEQPTALTPDGSVVVGETKPKLSWNFIDFGGTSTDQAAYQVQIDPLGAGGGAADYDSGAVSSPLTGVDLATTGTYPGFSTAGGTTQWRVRVQDGSGLWSDWSDWATWTYRARPTLTINSPTGGALTDPTPPLTATSSATITAYRVTIADNADTSKLLHDSGRRAGSGTTIAYTPPLVDPVRQRPIFEAGKTYRITYYVEDTYARDGWAQTASTTATFSDTGAITAPVLVSVTPSALGLPQYTLSWTRATAPDNWLVLLDGQPYARLDPAQVSVAGTTYTWADPGMVTGHESHSWTVKAIVNSVQGPASNTAQTSTPVTGVWLVSAAGAVVLRDVSPDSWTRSDRVAVYRPLSAPVPVVVYDAQEGLSGQVSGVLRDEPGSITHTQALTRLRAMKADPATPVWLVAERVAVPVWLLSLTWAPHSETKTGRLWTRVAADFAQATDPQYGA